MEYYEQTLSDVNRAIAEKSDRSQALAQRGETHRLRGDLASALGDFNQAIGLNPDYTWALAHRGQTYFQVQRYESAIADFNQAIELNPNYTWAIAHRGVTYRFMGEAHYTMALADLTRAIELKPDYIWAIGYRCRVYELMKCYKESLIDFDRVIPLDENIFEKNWLTEKALLLCYDGQYSQAIACSQQRLQQVPDDTTALYCIAVSKARWQGLDAAKIDIERSRSALLSQGETGDRGDILYRLSGLAILEDKCEQAWQYLQEAIPLNDEAIELAADHDPAWANWRHDSRTQALVTN
ncbi:MAG: tetratricopeptide repeat protein [Calothrix sp. MO_167.B42]|nr:tetratricopeptide repeat protein [Calothrix sp. MO_167.B42]